MSSDTIQDIESVQQQQIGIFDRIKAIFPANRIVALIGVVGAIVAFLVTIQTSLVPGSPAAEAIAKAIVLLGAMGTFLGTVLKFLHGSQQWDKLVLGALGGSESKVEGENVTVVNSGGSSINDEQEILKLAQDTPADSLPDAPGNPLVPDHEITEDDVTSEFGVQPDIVSPEATQQRLEDEGRSDV